MFDARIRMLGFVERWNIAPRLHRQSVAEHSYFVALNVSTLADWAGIDGHDKVRLLDYALRHDLAEIVTGDTPGPSKRAVVDPVKLAAYEEEFLASIGEDGFLSELTPENRAIVKAADTIEAWFWVALEVARGNVLMGGEIGIAADRAMKAILALDGFFPHLSSAYLYQGVEAQVQRLFGPIELSPRLDTDLPQGKRVFDPSDEIPF